MSTRTSRRDFIATTAGAAAGIALGARPALAQEGAEPAAAGGRRFGISLAGWSLHRTIGAGDDQVPMLEMPRIAREEFGIEAIELVNNMLPEWEAPYYDQLMANAARHDVAILLIMVDGQGAIGGETGEARDEAVSKHSYWIDVAADMGCHSIRMNWAGAPHDVITDAEALQAFIDRSAPAFTRLCEYGDTKGVNVIIENHGGPSSYIEPMQQLMKTVGHPRFGTLPDFGNFPPAVDKYDAIDAMMPYAKAVSAKCYDFDPETGEETTLDYPRLIDIVVDQHDYHGFIGIEYEGNRLSEYEGIRACKELLERLRTA